MGIFNRESKGYRTEPVNIDVERGRLQFFARVTGIRDAIHFDIEAARTAGYPDIVAPPTFQVVIGFLASAELERQGHQSVTSLINADYKRLLHATERCDYHDKIYAGDQVAVVTEVSDFQDKKNGALEFAHLTVELSHPVRGILVTVSRSLVHRLE